MAAAGGGGAPPLDFSNPLQSLIALAVLVLVGYALYRLFS
jgi:hypothetical protein